MAYLGIAQTNHGSSAAVFDGKRLFAISEERLDRVKFSSGYPRSSIDWCLSEAGLSIHDIKSVGFYMTTSNHLASRKARQNDIWQSYPESLYTVPSEILKKIREDKSDDLKHLKMSLDFFGGEEKDIYFIDHHLAHAAASYLSSGFKDAAILCLDANGDGYTMSWMDAVDSVIKPVLRQPFPHSIGHFYSAFTQFIGFNPNADEYKVMGMAAQGKGERYYEPVKKMLRLFDDGTFELDMSLFSFNMPTERFRYNRRFPEALKLSPNTNTSSIDQSYYDLSAALQKVFEEVIRHIVGGLKRKIKKDNLCFGGGAALNCLANGRSIPHSEFKEIFIPPNPGDTGLAIGCAAYLAHVIDSVPRKFVYESDYLGPEYSASSIKQILNENGLSFTEPKDLPKVVASKLADSKVVGLFQGRQEFGPRALGNRSILADPRKSEMKDLVNKKIKFREAFRPFAPSATDAGATEIFDLGGRKPRSNSPEAFMLSTATVKPEWSGKLQATTHFDGSSRLQIVEKNQNPLFHSIISEFGKASGVNAVMNTSFNVKDEPIVLSPEHAIRCFYSTGMDALALGPFLLEKSK